MAYFIPARKNMRDNYHGVSRLHEDIDRLFNGGMYPGRWGAQGTWPAESVAPTPDILPQVDVTSDDAAYTMYIELPGVGPDEVNIKVDDNVLTVSGEKKPMVKEEARMHVQERAYGSFARSMSLPEDADVENIRAFAKNGVLCVEIPRKKHEVARTRTIEVQRG